LIGAGQGRKRERRDIFFYILGSAWMVVFNVYIGGTIERLDGPTPVNKETAVVHSTTLLVS
jgi:hypothetical protein